MKSFLIHAVAALALVAGFLMVPRSLAAEKLPKAEDILAKELEAVGGKEAQQKVKTVVMKGKVSVQGMKGGFARYYDGTTRSYEEFTIEGLLKQENGLNGDVAWEKSSLTGARLFQGKEKAKAVRDADVLGKSFKEARTLGEEKVEGKLAYKLRLTTLDGDVVIAHFDKQSGLQVRQEATVESAEGKMNLIMLFGDFRKVDGVTYPFAMKVLTGPAEVAMTVDRIEHNVKIPAERFALPAEITKLVEKSKKQ